MAEFRGLFDDTSDEETDFEGFTDAEIFGRAGNEAAGDDSGPEQADLVLFSDAHSSESDIVDSDEHSSDSDAGVQRAPPAPAAAAAAANANLQWVGYAEGEAIVRANEVPQHPNGNDTKLKPVKEYPSPPNELDIFSEFFTDEMFDLIVLQTNLDANRKREAWVALGGKNGPQPDARIGRWVDTNAIEIQAFFGLRIAMGLAPRNQAGDYFDTTSSFWLFETPNYRRVMSKRRFEILSACLHFVDNEEQVHDTNSDQYNPLFKIQPLIDIVAENWRTAVKTGPFVSLDESMVPFRGRFQGRQYIKSKHHRYGVKGFALCDAQTCYCIKYDIYTGRFYDYDRDLHEHFPSFQFLITLILGVIVHFK